MICGNDRRKIGLSLLATFLLAILFHTTLSADQGVPPEDKSFSCADNLVAYRDTGIIVDYLGADENGHCVVRYNQPDRSRASVSHYEWIWGVNTAYPDESRQIHHDVLFKDMPGQTETMPLRGGHTITFTVVDRADYPLNDARHPCLHYSATFRGGGGGGYTEVSGHFWVDPTNGIILKASGTSTYTVVSLKPMDTHKPISEMPH